MLARRARLLPALGAVCVVLASCATQGDVHGAVNDAVSTLRQYPDWAWAAGIALLWADLLLPVPQTTVIAALGIVYGTVVGGLVGSVGLITGGLLGYLVMRTALRGIVRRLMGRRFEKMESLFARGGTWAIVLTRSLPYSIPEALIFLAGLAGMPMRKFLAALAVGNIPIAFAFSAIGAGWSDEPGLALVVSFVLPILMLPVVLLLLRRRAS